MIVNDRLRPESRRQIHDTGATMHFVAHRILYLRQHPDGAPGQEIRMDTASANCIALVIGALSDLIVSASGLAAPWSGTGINIKDPVSLSVTMRLRQPPTGAGTDILRSLSKSWDLRRLSDGHELVFELDAASIKAGLELLADDETCPPLIMPE